MSVRETIKEIVDVNDFLHIATIDAQGAPTVRGVDYVGGDEENVVYFATYKNSRKVEHIKINPVVGFVIDRQETDPQAMAEMKYLKGVGRASLIENPEEANKVLRRLIQKYPLIADLPGDPSDFVCVRLEMENLLVTDNTLGFGHTEEFDF